MLNKFWETVGGKLADRWAAIAGPALVFWLGGLLAWWYDHNGDKDPAALTRWLGRQSVVAQIILLLAVLVGVVASGLLVNRLTFPMLRLLEGYWPSWLNWLSRTLVRRITRRAERDAVTWQSLVERVQPSAVHGATPEEIATFTRLDLERHRRPSTANRYLPTRLGNTLRAAEARPADKYGLDSVVVWPRLWLLIPDRAREELIAARMALDSAAAATLWGLLFCIFAWWTPLAVPLGIGLAVLAAGVWAPPRAETFADLVDAAYDLYRVALYQRLRWPLPKNPEEEQEQGRQITEYLWRGSNAPEPPFASPPAP